MVLYHQWSRLWSQLSQMRRRGSQPPRPPRRTCSSYLWRACGHRNVEFATIMHTS